MIRPDITGQRDYLTTLAERGFAVIGDVLDPVTVLDPILDTMVRQLGSWAREQISREILPRTSETWPLENRLMLLAEEIFALLSAPSLLDIRGSDLLMHARTVHSSMPNVTPDRVRLSLDLRLADQELGKFNRWDPEAAMCA